MKRSPTAVSATGALLKRGLHRHGLTPAIEGRIGAIRGQAFIDTQTRPLITSRRPLQTVGHSSTPSSSTLPKMDVAKKEKEKESSVPRPSASIILLSPTNQVLLLHRVQTSSSFPSAHVFPGGNLSAFHDGTIASVENAGRHEDSLAYRLGAIRETFEESGILLARKERSEASSSLLSITAADRDKARKSIYANEVGFVRWLESVGGVADTDNLIPFTRWITPLGRTKRFTTQMYIYMLPLLTTEEDSTISTAQREAVIPTPDGGSEITASYFDEVSSWLDQQRKGDIVMFPPQCFLLYLLSPYLTGPPPATESLSLSETIEYYRTQREKLRGFLATVPTASDSKAARHHTARISWGDKVISPVALGMRQSDQRVILGLDKPGPELKGSSRGGDWERVVLVNFTKGIAKDVEVRNREEILVEEREAQKKTKQISKL